MTSALSALDVLPFCRKKLDLNLTAVKSSFLRQSNRVSYGRTAEHLEQTEQISSSFRVNINRSFRLCKFSGSHFRQSSAYFSSSTSTRPSCSVEISTSIAFVVGPGLPHVCPQCAPSISAQHNTCLSTDQSCAASSPDSHVSHDMMSVGTAHNHFDSIGFKGRLAN